MRKIIGVITIMMVLAAGTMALIFSYNISLTFGLALTAAHILGWILVGYSYCAKCQCGRHNCNHVLPYLLIKLLPKRKAAPYGALDMLGTFLGIVLILLPVSSLLQNRGLLILYGVIVILAIIEIIIFLCKGCENKYCAMSR